MMTADQDAHGSNFAHTESPRSGSHIDPDEEDITDSPKLEPAAEPHLLPDTNISKVLTAETRAASSSAAVPPHAEPCSTVLEETTVLAAVEVTPLEAPAEPLASEVSGEVFEVSADGPVAPLEVGQVQPPAQSSECVDDISLATPEVCEVEPTAQSVCVEVEDIPLVTPEISEIEATAPEIFADTSTTPECEQPLLPQASTEEMSLVAFSPEPSPTAGAQSHIVPVAATGSARTPRSVTGEVLREPLAARATSSLLEDIPTSRIAGDPAWKIPGISSVDSTCATSTFSGGTACDQRLSALLKASPPQPVGRVAGRFTVRLWRSCVTQPFGISFGTGKLGAVIVAEDAAHLGLRRGDEVISINGQSVVAVRQCKLILSGSRDLDMHLYHREFVDASSGSRGMYGGCVEYHEVPVCCETCLNPPEPKCRAESWPMRDVLSTTGPVPIDGSGLFGVQIVRMSRKQLFGLVIAATPCGASMSESSSASASTHAAAVGARMLLGEGNTETLLIESAMSRENTIDLSEQETRAEDGNAPVQAPVSNADVATMFVKEKLPQYGLLEGDILLMINGHPANNVDTCKMFLKTAMSISLEFQRPGQVGLVRRMEEPSISGVCSSKDFAAEPHSQSWFSSLSRRLGLRLCCMGQGYSPVWDETSGADPSHDLDISKLPADEACVQPV